METAVFLSFNALGDTVCTTTVVRAFRRMHPDARIFYVAQNAGFCRILEQNADIDLVIYNEALYLRGYEACTAEWVQTLPLNLVESALMYRLDMNLVCSREESFQEHISVGLSKLLDIPIDSVRPTVVLDDRDRRAARLYAARPYVLFSMNSLANPPRKDGLGKAKEWQREKWEALAGRFCEGGFDVFALGSETDPLPDIAYVRPLHGLPIRVVAALIEGSACFVTLENGLAHLAAAFDPPMVELYSSLMPLAWAKPAESVNCRLLYGDPFEFSTDEVWKLVEDALSVSGSRV